jgi:hypothetical protein
MKILNQSLETDLSNSIIQLQKQRRDIK